MALSELAAGEARRVRWALGSLTALLAIMLLPVVWVEALLGADGCGTSAPTPPGVGVHTAGQLVRYFEREGISPNGSAGIVGNLRQESGLDPRVPGGGLAQWNSGRYAAMSAYATAQGLAPTSTAGQLTYLVHDLRANYPHLLAALNTAADPGTAATMFETTYELCSGVIGYMRVTPGSACEDGNRRLYAVMSLAVVGDTTTPVPLSLTTGGACVTLPGRYVDPLERATAITWERTDQGVDASMAVGSPIVALGDCQVKLIVPFYAGQPAIVCELLDGPLAGHWWYMAEQVTPQVTVGQTVQAGQQIATYAPTGSAIETGWWEPGGGYPLGHDGYNEGVATLAGADFRYLLSRLGAGAGTGQGLSSGLTFGTSDYP